jgi:hypothetical protein
MDLNSLRNMAGLPPLTENFSGFEKLQAKDLDSMQLNADLPSAGPALISQYKGSEDVFMMLAVDPDEKKIRVAVENPRRGSTHVKYFANDKAGYDNAVKYAQQLRTVKPNVSEEAVSEEAMVPSIEMQNEDNVMKACIVLAKEGMTVDLEYAMDVFYFNFKTKQARDKAAKLVKYLLDKENVAEGAVEEALVEGFDSYSEKHYEYANGKKPSGRGKWMFAAKKDIDMRTAKKDVDYFEAPYDTLYSEAKKLALAWAKKNGIASISVLS